MGLKGPTCYMVYSVGVKRAKNIPRPYNRAQALWGGEGSAEVQPKAQVCPVFFLSLPSVFLQRGSDLAGFVSNTLHCVVI